VNWYLPGAVWKLVLVWLGDWKDVPAASRRTWWVSLGWGLLATVALTLLLVLKTRSLERGGWLESESAALVALEAAELISFNDAIWLDVFGNGFVLTAMISVSAGIAAFRRRPLFAIALALGYASLFIPVVIGWLAWGRTRPTIIASGIGSPGALLSSFPSGHLVQAIVAFGILCYLWLRNGRSFGERSLTCILYLLLVFTVALARLRLGAHWPSDMIAAAIIGFFWLAMVVRALRAAESVSAQGRPRTIDLEQHTLRSSPQMMFTPPAGDR
jgi:membrane-associated phospholipid phosphatase